VRSHLNRFLTCYIDEHSNPVWRRLHFVESLLVLLLLAAVFVGALLGIPLIGYGFACIGTSFSDPTARRPSSIRCTARWATGSCSAS
jgi:hypothetical protein